MSAAAGRREWTAEEDRRAAGVGHRCAESGAVKISGRPAGGPRSGAGGSRRNPAKRWTHRLPLAEM